MALENHFVLLIIWHQKPLSLKRENYVRKIHLQHSLILRKHMIKYIDRGILFTKLLKFGISGLMYKALLALYDGVRCSVRINGKLTELFNVNCGLMQGCSLSSILFNLYINDF